MTRKPRNKKQKNLRNSGTRGAILTRPTPRKLNRICETQYFPRLKESLWIAGSYLIAFSLMAWPVYSRGLAMLFGEVTEGVPTSLSVSKTLKGRTTERIELKYRVGDNEDMTNNFPVGIGAHHRMRSEGIPVKWEVWYVPSFPRISGIEDDYGYTRQLTVMFLCVATGFIGIAFGAGAYLKYIKDPRVRSILTHGDPVKFQIGKSRLASTSVTYEYSGKLYRKRFPAAKILYATKIDGEVYGFVDKNSPGNVVVYGTGSYQIEA